MHQIIQLQLFIFPSTLGPAAVFSKETDQQMLLQAKSVVSLLTQPLNTLLGNDAAVVDEDEEGWEEAVMRGEARKLLADFVNWWMVLSELRQYLSANIMGNRFTVTAFKLTIKLDKNFQDACT